MRCVRCRQRPQAQRRAELARRLHGGGKTEAGSRVLARKAPAPTCPVHRHLGRDSGVRSLKRMDGALVAIAGT